MLPSPLLETIFILACRCRIALALVCAFANPLVNHVEGSVPKVSTPARIAITRIDHTKVEKESAGTGGTYVALIENHYDLSTEQQYFRIAKRLNTEAGLQDQSQIEVSYDPAYQNIAFHTLRIHRDGKIIDLLPEQHFKLLQREQDHERQTYDNRLRAIALLEGTRVGDVIDYSYSISGINPVFGELFHWSLPTSYPFPVGQVKASVRAPMGTELYFNSRGRIWDPELSRDGTDAVYSWVIEEPGEFVPDMDLPADLPAMDTIEASTTSTWKEIHNWALTNYPPPSSLPAELEDLARKIETEAPSEEDKILSALRFAQDEIRYLGIFEGVHSHRPHNLEEIMTRRFGDCKDKSTLLCALLTRLGFNASPALVNTSQGAAISDWLPSLNAFDHLVVSVEFEGNRYWMDPTGSFQRGSLADLFFPDYGYAMLVRDGEGDLIKIGEQGYRKSRKVIREKYTLAGFTKPTDVEIITHYHGQSADTVRALFASEQHSVLEQKFYESDRESHPGVEKGEPFRFEDNQEKNIFTIHRFYRIPDMWGPKANDKSMMQARFGSQPCMKALTAPSDPKRSDPLAVTHPLYIAHKITVKLPVAIPIATNDVSIDNSTFRYQYQAEQNDTTSEFTFLYESKTDRVSADQLPSFTADAKRAMEATAYALWIPKELYNGSMTAQQYAESRQAQIQSSSPGNSGDAEAKKTGAPDLSPSLPFTNADVSSATTATDGFVGTKTGSPDLPPAHGINSDSSSGNTPTVLIAVAIGLLSGLFLSVFAMARKPGPKFRHPYEARLDGIRGWLILPAVIFTVNPIVFGIAIIGIASLGFISQAGNSVPEMKDVANQTNAVLAVNAAGLALLLPFSIIVAIRFFQKHYTAPRIILAFYGLTFILNLANFAVAKMSPVATGSSEVMNDLLKGLLPVLIFGTYFFRSRRVSSTFRKNIPAGLHALGEEGNSSSHATPSSDRETPRENREDTVPGKMTTATDAKESSAASMFSPVPELASPMPPEYVPTARPHDSQQDPADRLFDEPVNAPPNSLFGPITETVEFPFDTATKSDEAPTPFGSDTSPPTAS